MSLNQKFDQRNGNRLAISSHKGKNAIPPIHINWQHWALLMHCYIVACTASFSAAAAFASQIWHSCLQSGLAGSNSGSGSYDPFAPAPPSLPSQHHAQNTGFGSFDQDPFSPSLPNSQPTTQRSQVCFPPVMSIFIQAWFSISELCILNPILAALCGKEKVATISTSKSTTICSFSSGALLLPSNAQLHVANSLCFFTNSIRIQQLQFPE